MAEVLLSPGIQITETDRSFVPARPLVAGAAIIGPTAKGPANVPIKVTSYGDYQRMFGTTFMMNRYKENYEEAVAEALKAKRTELTPWSGSFTAVDLEEGYVRKAGVTYYTQSGSEYVEVPDSQSLDSDVDYYVKNDDETYSQVEKEQLRSGSTAYYRVNADEAYEEELFKLELGVQYYTTNVAELEASSSDKDLYPTLVSGSLYYNESVKDVFNEEFCETREARVYAPFNAPASASLYKKHIEDVMEEAKDSDEIWETVMISQKSQEFLTSIAAKSFFEQGGESLLVLRATDNEFKSGRAEIKTENEERVAFEIKTISQGEYINNWKEGVEFQNRTETTASIDGVIRTDGSLISGSKDNIRWEIADVDPETGTFSIYVRRGDDVDYDKNILEAFTGLNLDPDSANYVARRIGDQHQELIAEPTDDDFIYYVTVKGNYPNVSKYIYVDNVNAIYGYFLADGYTRRGSAEDETAAHGGEVVSGSCVVTYPDDVANLLPEVCEGGFYGAEGKLFSTHEDEAKALFFEDINAANADPGLHESVKIQGVDPVQYEPLIAILQNQDEYEINMISVPGLTVAFNSTQVDMVNSLASKRGDLIAVVDLVGFGSKIGDVQQKAVGLNSSYSATYWPWLQMYSSTGRLEWVPASVIIPGIYVYNDHVAAPWFAPAGMTRGSVQGVIQTERKLLKQNRDDLYKKNVNPIATFPGGIQIYGQKTLQKKATALDRVNVRRLMIELKRTVKNMANGILFEQNDAQLRGTFKANLDQYLESVVKRRGLYAYKTIVEEVNTPDVIDRNEFRCQIYIQPTKVIEFIYIDFTITNTGVDFNN